MSMEAFWLPDSGMTQNGYAVSTVKAGMRMAERDCALVRVPLAAVRPGVADGVAPLVAGCP